MAKHPRYYVDVGGDTGKVKVPSVTGICNRFQESGGLMGWANLVGRGERDCDDQVPCEKCGRREGKTTWEANASAKLVGNLGHDLIDNRVKGTEIDWDEYAHLTDEEREQANMCLEAFESWYRNNDVDVIETELPLTSLAYMFGGRFDAVATVSGVFALLDWKTSKHIYESYMAQLAGYVLLIEEDNRWGEKIQEIHILRVSKNTAGFNHMMIPRDSFEPAIEWFINARTLLYQEKALKGLLE